MGGLLLLAAYFVRFVSSYPSTLDINAPGCGTNQLGNVFPDHYIAGGETANPHAYPWMAAILKRGMFHCGGSYIKGNNGHSYILTTASCADGSLETDLEIRLGRHDLSTSETSSEQHIGVSNIIKHPSYVAHSHNWDVALLQLVINPTDNVYVWPGCIPLSDITEYETAFVTGWGTQDGSLPHSLHVVDRYVLPHSVCRNQLGSNNFFDMNMLCTEYRDDGADLCQVLPAGDLAVVPLRVQQCITIPSHQSYG